MECGEIDFAMLLDEQKGRPLNMNFVGLYWEQVGRSCGYTNWPDARGGICSPSGKRCPYGLEARKFRAGQRSIKDNRLWYSESDRK